MPDVWVRGMVELLLWPVQPGKVLFGQFLMSGDVNMARDQMLKLFHQHPKGMAAINMMELFQMHDLGPKAAFSQVGKHVVFCVHRKVSKNL